MTLKVGDYVQRIPDEQRGSWAHVMRLNQVDPNGVYRIKSVDGTGIRFFEIMSGAWNSTYFKKDEDVSNLTIEDFM